MSHAETAAQAKPAPAAEDSRLSTQHQRKPGKVTAADFDYGRILGAGSFGNVFHVCLRGTDHEYAMKIMQKSFIRKEQKIHFVKMERDVLTKAVHPNIIKLAYSFQDEENLYIITELCRGGELLRVIRTFNAAARQNSGTRGGLDCSSDSESDADDRGRITDAIAGTSQTPAHSNASSRATEKLTMNPWGAGLPLPLAQYYIAQLVCALEYLHTSLHVIHRDLKPENVLLSLSGHVKLADFGSAKDEDAQFNDARQEAFVGTAEYVSPEVLRDEPAHAPVDLWALGCVLYQCLAGVPPFRGGSEYLTFQLILGLDAELNDPDTNAAGTTSSSAPIAADDVRSSSVRIDPRSEDASSVDRTSTPNEPTRIMRRSSSGELSRTHYPLTSASYVGIGAVVVDDAASRGTPRSARGSSTGGVDADHQQLLAFLETIPENDTTRIAEGGGFTPPKADSSGAALQASPSSNPGSALRASASSRQQHAAVRGETRRPSRAGSISAALASRAPPSILRFPVGFPADARHLILSLLRPLAAQRLGVVHMPGSSDPDAMATSTGRGKPCGTVIMHYGAIKKHPFFAGVDWDHVCDPRARAPFIPAPTKLRHPRPALEARVGSNGLDTIEGASSLASLDSDDATALHVLPHVKAALAAAQKQAIAARQQAVAAASAATSVVSMPSVGSALVESVCPPGSPQLVVPPPTPSGKSPSGVAVLSSPTPIDPKKRSLGKALSAMFLPLFGSPRATGVNGDTSSISEVSLGAPSAAPTAASTAREAVLSTSMRRNSSESAESATQPSPPAASLRPHAPPKTDPGPAMEGPDDASITDSDAVVFRPSAITSATPQRSPPSSPLPTVRFLSENGESLNQPVLLVHLSDCDQSTDAMSKSVSAAMVTDHGTETSCSDVREPHFASVSHLPATQTAGCAPATLLSYVRDGYISHPRPGDTGLMPMRVVNLVPQSQQGGALPSSSATPLSVLTGLTADARLAVPAKLPSPTASTQSHPDAGVSATKTTTSSATDSQRDDQQLDVAELRGAGYTTTNASVGVGLSPPGPQPSTTVSWWMTHVNTAAGETVLKSGNVEKRKAGYLQLFGPMSRELVLCHGGPGGPRLLYCNPHTRERPVSVLVADPETKIFLREGPATARMRSDGTVPPTHLMLKMGSSSDVGAVAPAVPPTPLARFASWLGVGRSSVQFSAVVAGQQQPPPLALDAPALSFGSTDMTALNRKVDHSTASAGRRVSALTVESIAAAIDTNVPRGHVEAPISTLEPVALARDPAAICNTEETLEGRSVLPASSHSEAGANPSPKVTEASSIAMDNARGAVLSAEHATPLSQGSVLPPVPNHDSSTSTTAVVAPTPLTVRSSGSGSGGHNNPGMTLTTPGGTGSGVLLENTASATPAHGLLSPDAVALHLADEGRLLRPPVQRESLAQGQQVPDMPQPQARPSRLGSLPTDIATFDMKAFDSDPRSADAAPVIPVVVLAPVPTALTISAASLRPPSVTFAAATSRGDSPVVGIAGATAFGTSSPEQGGLKAIGGAARPTTPAGGSSGSSVSTGRALAVGNSTRDLGILDVVTSTRTFFLYDPLGGAEEWLLAVQKAVREFRQQAS